LFTRCAQSKTSSCISLDAHETLVAWFLTNYDGLVVLFRVLLGGVLVMLDGVQMVAVRDLGVMRSLFMIAGLVMFGGFAMMLGRILMMLRGMFVVLVNLVIVHGSLSGFIGKGRSIAAFDEPFSTPLCQIGAAPRYAARPAHVPSCATSCRTACTTLSQLPNVDCR
jgi:hypothetical protein